MFFQDGLTGSAWGDWANYTDSPIRAFEADGGWTEHHPTPRRKKKPSGLLLRIWGVVCQILEGLLYFLKGPGLNCHPVKWMIMIDNVHGWDGNLGTIELDQTYDWYYPSVYDISCLCFMFRKENSQNQTNDRCHLLFGALKTCWVFNMCWGLNSLYWGWSSHL